MNTLDQIKSIEHLIESSEIDNVKLGLISLIVLGQNGEIPNQYMRLANRVLNDMRCVIDLRSSFPLSLLNLHYEIAKYRLEYERKINSTRN